MPLNCDLKNEQLLPGGKKREGPFQAEGSRVLQTIRCSCKGPQLHSEGNRELWVAQKYDSTDLHGEQPTLNSICMSNAIQLNINIFSYYLNILVHKWYREESN